MPGYAYGLPAKNCKVGSTLQKVPGSVCEKCYALKGRYVFKNVQNAQERRLASLTHPQWVEAMVFLLKHKKAKHFRWHDSGDIQNEQHLANIIAVATACPEVHFWLPTRETGIILNDSRHRGPVPSNLVIRVSGTMVNDSPLTKYKNTSTVAFKGLPQTGHVCPAPAQGGKCQDCRACWDPNVKNVGYVLH